MILSLTTAERERLKAKGIITQMPSLPVHRGRPIISAIQHAVAKQRQQELHKTYDHIRYLNNHPQAIRSADPCIALATHYLAHLKANNNRRGTMRDYCKQFKTTPSILSMALSAYRALNENNVE